MAALLQAIKVELALSNIIAVALHAVLKRLGFPGASLSLLIAHRIHQRQCQEKHELLKQSGEGKATRYTGAPLFDTKDFVPAGLGALLAGFQLQAPGHFGAQRALFLAP